MNAQDVENLIHDYLDGVISSEELNILQDILKNDPAAKAIYRESVFLHSALQQQSQVINPAATNVIPMERVIRRQKKKTLKIAAIVAVALLLVGFATMSLFMTDVNQSPLTFKTSPGTQFSLTHDSEAKPESLVMRKGSKLILSQGAVELTFESGVRSIVLAPASITLVADDTLHMDEGTAWFHVPSGAEGFKVNSSDLHIVDLGTEFGVIVKPGDHDEVHCLAGKIKVTAQRVRKESVELSVGESKQINPIGQLKTIPAKSKYFLNSLPKTLPHLHLSFDRDDEIITNNTLIGSPTISVENKSSLNYTKGKFGSALSLNGKQHLMTDWKGILQDSPRTVAFWVKMPEFRDPHTVTLLAWGAQQADYSLNNKFTIHLDGRQFTKPTLNISFGGFWYHTRETTLDDNQWHHLTVVYEGKMDKDGLPITRLYIDGVEVKIHRYTLHPEFSSWRNGIPVNTKEQTPLTLGANLSKEPARLIKSDNFLKGQLDELFIIEGILSEQEILHLKQNNLLE